MVPPPTQRKTFISPTRKNPRGKDEPTLPCRKSVPEIDNSLPNIPPSQPGPFRSGGRNIMSSCVGDFFHEEIQHSALRPNKSVNLFRLINRIICDDNQVFPPPALMARGLFRSICPPFEGCCRLSLQGKSVCSSFEHRGSRFDKILDEGVRRLGSFVVFFK